MAVIVKTACF